MNATRRDLLEILGDLSQIAPDLRFGQLIANLATLAKGAQPESVWDVEDDEMTAAARRLLDRYQSRRIADSAS